MIQQQLPLVSCVMPTYNRREFVPHAIRYFLLQDYPNKELIILDDGSDIIADLIPVHPSISYYRFDHKITLGAKLNLGCNYSHGDIIANWDDDDWYASWRLSYQVKTLQREGTELCGINELLYYDFRNRIAFRYIYPPDQRIWLLGSSLCYTKALWQRIQFAEINVGMDGLFVWSANPDEVTVLKDPTFAVHMIHSENVSPKQTGGEWWHPNTVDEIQQLMGSDWTFYGKGIILPCEMVPSPETETGALINKSIPLFQNIYACLVHERADCITDLVNNLRYHDPSSVILLYNGSEDPLLLSCCLSDPGPGVVCHPTPRPVKHGYLHSFALDCMQFAIENFSFDSITIVDSDQLAIRSGYTGRIKELLSAHPGIGMLSSNPARVKKGNSNNRVALQAFDEYDLWKPFIDSFENGESNFAHWTFWPSTVFTAAACTDLVKIFKENEQLQAIMRRTKIWASEEVILPTLVKLLGYDIFLNPCSYDYVKYQYIFTTRDFGNALRKADAYWIHPVERVYESWLRKYIRDTFNNYAQPYEQIVAGNVQPAETGLKSSIVTTIQKVEGWLSDKEAGLLIEMTLLACKNSQGTHNIVEIGSYHGKSTILFGTILNRLFQGSKVYAIDTHDGMLGAADQGLQVFPPSFNAFTNNILQAGLSGVVESIQKRSYDVEWSEPILLLYIDGLHDYLNVSRDFWHLSNWVIPEGFIIFHDYAVYFPGVINFVGELLTSYNYLLVERAESLVVLQKRLN